MQPRLGALLVLFLGLGRHLVLEDHAEDLAAQAIGQPGVLDDGQLEALAAQRRVVVGVDGAAHALDDHQVRPALPHHRGQDFVQPAGERKSSGERVCMRITYYKPGIFTFPLSLKVGNKRKATQQNTAHYARHAKMDHKPITVAF